MDCYCGTAVKRFRSRCCSDLRRSVLIVLELTERASSGSDLIAKMVESCPASADLISIAEKFLAIFAGMQEVEHEGKSCWCMCLSVGVPLGGK